MKLESPNFKVVCKVLEDFKFYRDKNISMDVLLLKNPFGPDPMYG